MKSESTAGVTHSGNAHDVTPTEWESIRSRALRLASAQRYADPQNVHRHAGARVCAGAGVRTDVVHPLLLTLLT